VYRLAVGIWRPSARSDSRNDLFLALSFAITDPWFNIFAVPLSAGLACLERVCHEGEPPFADAGPDPKQFTDAVELMLRIQWSNPNA